MNNNNGKHDQKKAYSYDIDENEIQHILFHLTDNFKLNDNLKNRDMFPQGKNRYGVRPEENSGIAGFYDEMIVLFVVVIALSIFFNAVLQAYDSYEQQRDVSGNYEVSSELLDNIRHADILTHDGKAGLFEGHKIKALNMDNFTSNFNTPTHNYFSMEIIDLGNSTVKYGTDLTNFDHDGPGATITEYRYVLTSPISIWINDEDIRPGQLKLEVWK